MPLYLSLFFLQCPHLYICIVCMYICLNCIYMYLYVYCQCLMLTICTKGLRVTQFQLSVCMCCTCGRIDNKADLTWLDLTWDVDRSIGGWAIVLWGWRFGGAAPLGCCGRRQIGPRVDGRAFPGRREIGLEVCTPPSPEPSRRDDWLLGTGRGLRPRPALVPFFPEVHEELMKSWTAPFYGQKLLVCLPHPLYPRWQGS